MGHSGVRSGSSEEKESSKSTRKFDKKVKFYSKVRDTVASLRAKKEIGKKKPRSRQKKLKAYDLASLTELLPELESSGKQTDATTLKLNNKNRLKLVEKEGKQFKAVLSNPVFQSDPLAAILQHLEQTQPSPPVEQPKKKMNKNGSMKRKKLKASSSSSSHAMEL